MTGEVKATIEARVNTGWRVHFLSILSPFIGWLPHRAHERLIDWAVKGVKVDTFVR